MGEGIFISYRRGADNSAASLLYNALRDAFGAEDVFMDIDNIPLGSNFVDHIQTHIAECRIMLVVVGKGWHERLSEMSGPVDFVRLEIEVALARPDLVVVPVFFDNAGMPHPDTIPDSLLPLVQRNGITIPHEHSGLVVRERLIPSLREILAAPRPAVPPPPLPDVPGTVRPPVERPEETKTVTVEQAREIAEELLGSEFSKARDQKDDATSVSQVEPPKSGEDKSGTIDVAKSDSEVDSFEIRETGTERGAPSDTHRRAPAASPLTEGKPQQAKPATVQDKSYLGAPNADEDTPVSGRKWHLGMVVMAGALMLLIAMISFNTGRQPDAFGTQSGAIALPGNIGSLENLQLSPMGPHMVAVTTRGNAAIVDLVLGQVSKTFSGSDGFISAAAISPDGRKVAFVTQEGRIGVVELTGKRERVFDGTSRTESMVFNGYSDHLVTGSLLQPSEKWNIDTGVLSDRYDGRRFGYADLSQDGNTIVTATFTTASVWDKEYSQLEKQFTIGKSTNISRAVSAVSTSANGNLVAVGTSDGSVIVWDVASGHEIMNLVGHDGRVLSVDLSFDGSHLLTAGHDKTIRVWDVASGSELGRLFDGPGRDIGDFNGAIFTADGQRIYVYGVGPIQIFPVNVRIGGTG